MKFLIVFCLGKDFIFKSSLAGCEGFSCVPQNQCENLIDLLFNSSSLICQDSSQTCCHESQKIDNVTISTNNEEDKG